MIYLDTESLFPLATELSIAAHRIEKIATEKPPAHPETCHIPAALYFVEQLGKMYRGQVRFWEMLATIARSSDTSARKRARIKSLARQARLEPEQVVSLLSSLTVDQMKEEATAAKKTFYQYRSVADSYNDGEDPTEFLQFAQWQYGASRASLEQLENLKRTMRSQMRGDSNTIAKSQEKMNVQYDTLHIENQVWFWQLVVNVLHEKILQQAAEDSVLG